MIFRTTKEYGLPSAYSNSGVPGSAGPCFCVRQSVCTAVSVRNSMFCLLKARGKAGMCAVCVLREGQLATP